jgi:hypothetical protein
MSDGIAVAGTEQFQCPAYNADPSVGCNGLYNGVNAQYNCRRHMKGRKGFSPCEYYIKGLRAVDNTDAASVQELNGIVASQKTIVENVVEENTALRKYVEELEAANKRLKRGTLATSNTTNNFYINVFPFHQVPPSELPPISEVRPLLRRPTHSVPELLKLKLQNEKTNNIRLNGECLEVLQMQKNGPIWKTTNKDECLKQVVGINLDHLLYHYHAEGTPIWKQWHGAFGKEEMKAQMKRVESVLQNIAQVIAQNDADGSESGSEGIEMYD